MIPKWTRIGDEYTFTWEDEQLAASVYVVDDDKAGLYAEVRFFSPLHKRPLFLRRFNLLAPRSVGEVVKELQQHGNAQLRVCQEITEAMCAIVIEDWRSPPDCTNLAALGEPDLDQPRFLDLEGFLPRGRTTIWYGPGENAKTLILMGVMVAFQCGLPVGGLRPVKTNPPIIPMLLDWEGDAEESRERLHAVSRGLGLERPPDMFYYRLTRPLHDEIRWLRHEVQVRGVNLIGIDSQMLAAGQDADTANAVLRLHRDLRSLGEQICFFPLTHMAKDALDLNGLGTPIGSIMNPNESRSVVRFQRGEDEEVEGNPDLIRAFRVGLFQTKSSFGRRHKLALRIELQTKIPGGPLREVRFTVAQIEEDRHLVGAEGASAMIEAVLRHERKPLTVREISERTGLPDAAVKTTLYRGRIFVQVTMGGGRGKPSTWGLAAPDCRADGE